jgi:multiple sugar transport system permease protein
MTAQPRRIARSAGKTALIYLAALLVLFFSLFPIIWMVLISFKGQSDALAIPPRIFSRPTLGNYVAAITTEGFGRYFINSLIVVLASVVISMSIGIPGAYALTRFEFRGKRQISLWILSVRIAPPIAFLIPFYVMYQRLHLLDTRVGLIIIYVAINLTITIWLMKGFFEDIPLEIEESALVEGCSPLQVFLGITLPLAMTGVAATAILIFIFTWNELMFAIVLTSNIAKTAPAGIYNFIGYNDIQWGELTAASTLVVIPVLVFILIMRKRLLRGLTFGAVK